MTYRDNIDKLARRITDRIPAKVKKLENALDQLTMEYTKLNSEKDKVDTYLGLEEPFETAVILSLGYRKEEPKYQKQRLSIDEVVEYR